MKLIFIRHGQTVGNIEKTHQGQSDGELTELGWEQARKVAVKLKDENIDYIYSSDLGRAANTAKEIAKFHPDTPIEFVKSLREKYMCADWHGMPHVEIGKLIDLHGLPEGAETPEKMVLRVQNFFNSVYTKHKNDIVLFVAHGGVGKAILIILRKLHASKFPEIEHVSNTSISMFEVNDDGHETLMLDNTSHLD
ncbi:MAG: histidine phosphatase family protein [archaeon]